MTEEHILRRPMVVGLLALLCNLLWGSAFPSVKVGYELFQVSGTASRILFAGCRFTLAGILTIVFGSILSKKVLKPGKASAGRIFKLSLVQTVLQYVLFYTGLALASGVRRSIIEGAGNLLAILAACLILKSEKLTKMKAMGCLVGFAGVILVNLGGDSAGGAMIGELAIFGSTVAYAMSSVMMKVYSKKENPVVLSGYQFLIGGAMMICFGLLAGGQLQMQTPLALVLLLYMALISSVAYTVWSILLKYNPVGKVAIYGFSNPIFGSLLSALILGEGSLLMGGKVVVSLILVSAGIYLVNRSQK